MARRLDQDNMKHIRSKNMADLGQAVGGINIVGKRIAVSANAEAYIGVGQLCRIVTGASQTLVSFGDVTAGNTNITCVADVADSLDGKYFILADSAGTVAFWIDVDNSGTVEPAHGADRSIEITTIATGDAIGTVGTAVYNAVTGDSEFTAVSDDTNGNIVVSSFNSYVESAGTSGFTLSSEHLGESITLPATSVNYVWTTDDYIYTDQACTVEVIKS